MECGESGPGKRSIKEVESSVDRLFRETGCRDVAAICFEKFDGYPRLLKGITHTTGVLDIHDPIVPSMVEEGWGIVGIDCQQRGSLFVNR